MRAICAAVLLLILGPVAGVAQEAERCTTRECLQKELEADRRALEEAFCLLEPESWQREVCLLRQLPPQRVCSGKKVPQEQIECLEGAIDALMRALPAIVADQVKKELQPRIHQ